MVIDDLSRGHRWALDGAPFHALDCGDTVEVVKVMRHHQVDAVIHLAGRSQVGESVQRPELYWRANVGAAAGLLAACREAGVRRFVLSSSAAVYGEPAAVPIPETHGTLPTNPYGATKRAIELMLEQLQQIGALSFVALRYFNAAGAMPDGSLGEDHDPETHLIPLALKAAVNTTNALTVFGDDYPTPDGTCLRDYVHVLDLARAHVLALDWMTAHPGGSLICNLGEGQGTSVREVLNAVEAETGLMVAHVMGPRRAGDPARLVAMIDRARAELGWQPHCSDVRSIVRDAWAWHRRHAAAD